MLLNGGFPGGALIFHTSAMRTLKLAVILMTSAGCQKPPAVEKKAAQPSPSAVEAPAAMIRQAKDVAAAATANSAEKDADMKKEE